MEVLNKLRKLRRDKNASRDNGGTPGLEKVARWIATGHRSERVEPDLLLTERLRTLKPIDESSM